MQPPRKENPYRMLALVSAIGIDLAGSILGGVLLGQWVDGKLGTEPAFLVTGLFGGLAFGIYGVAVLIKRFL